MKVIKIAIILILLASGTAIGTTVPNLTVDKIMQYPNAEYTVISFKENYTSPGNCKNLTWGPNSVLIRTNAEYASETVSLALSALLSGNKVDVGILTTCDHETDSVQWFKIKSDR